MIRLLSFIGQKSSFVLILGLVLAILLPSVSSALRPTLPFLVSLLLGLAIARLNFREVMREFLKTSKVLIMLGIDALKRSSFDYDMAHITLRC